MKGITLTLGAAAAGVAGYKMFTKIQNEKDVDLSKLPTPEIPSLSPLDMKITELAQKYSDDAAQLLRELIAIPEAHIKEDPRCGSSNHESARLEFLKQKIIELGAVSSPADIKYDDFGNLIWYVIDRSDATQINSRKVIYIDGRVDASPQKADWQELLGKGIDCYKGITDPSLVNDARMPPRESWDSLVFGHGATDLQGIVSAVFASKILVETLDMDCMKGCVVIGVASVAGVANPGGSIDSIMQSTNLDLWRIPDCVILTQSTGDVENGPCGIYIGQQGLCTIDVQVSGKGTTGNPIEYGSLIISEAVDSRRELPDMKFMGRGSQKVEWVKCDPSKFSFRMVRKITKGEDSIQVLKEVHSLHSITRARNAGLNVTVTLPTYVEQSWKGGSPHNEMFYPMWITEPENPVVMAALESYSRVISPINHSSLSAVPKVHRYSEPTNGVGFICSAENVPFSGTRKNWISNENEVHPPMFGIGAGYAERAGEVGEYVEKEHMWAPIAVIARFPGMFIKSSPIL